MNAGPGRHWPSSSRCHRVSTRCTDAPHSWQGGEASATSSALSIAGPTCRGVVGRRALYAINGCLDADFVRLQGVSTRPARSAMDRLPIPGSTVGPVRHRVSMQPSSPMPGGLATPGHRSGTVLRANARGGARTRARSPARPRARGGPPPSRRAAPRRPLRRASSSPGARRATCRRAGWRRLPRPRTP
jgi:hypothetical protein